MASRVREGALVLPRQRVEFEHELGVGGIDEVHAAEGPAVSVVGGSEPEEVRLVHEHRVLDVGGLFEGGEGGEVAALVVGLGLGDALGEETDLFTGRHVLCELVSLWLWVAFIDTRKKTCANMQKSMVQMHVPIAGCVVYKTLARPRSATTMSFPGVDKLKEALTFWRGRRRLEDFYEDDAEEKFLRFLVRTFIQLSVLHDEQFARDDIIQRFSCTGAYDEDFPSAPGVLANWVIHDLLHRWPVMAWTNGRWTREVHEMLFSMTKKGFVLHRKAGDLLRTQTLAVALACLKAVSGSTEKVVSESIVSDFLGAATAPTSSAAGGAAQPAPEPEAGSGGSDTQEKRAGGKRKRDDSDDDCVFVREYKDVIEIRD